MWAAKGKNYCRQLRNRVFRLLANSFTLDQCWIQNHIANCPRCQKRMANLGKVELAISLLKSRPHDIDLLRRANTQAIGVLKHSTRTMTKAEQLRNVRPDLNIFEKCSKYKRPIGNVAACIVIAFLAKSGIFNSAQKFETGGQKALEHYYASNAGEDIARDIFTTSA